MDKIAIQGYKSIKNLSLELCPINILIGSNGSGKSNFLSFFDFLNQIYENKLKEYININIEKFLHKGSKITNEIYSKIIFKKNAYSFVIRKEDGSFFFKKEGLWYDSSEKDIASYAENSNIKNDTGFRSYYIRKYLEQIKRYHFHDTSKNSPFTRVSNINNDKFVLYRNGENIDAFLFNMQQENPQHYNLIIETIQSIAPFFSDFVFKPEEENVVLRWTNKYSETIYGVNDLSDGALRFIALATLFMQPNLPQTIIIDEPELGLHPFALSKLAGMIKFAAAKKCQVIAATQSTDLISYFEPENIVTVDCKNGENQFNRLDKRKLEMWLDEYTIGDLWKRNIIDAGQPN